ncbi:hypothetical protein ACIU1J_01795 [Azospirillum doebereinerae]|uniref:hypothetical protein n=1 Tax=Azospirillum doebereinerae TaxID=92933 RepID=UPI001EE599E3|nr:hypothetical protein [Azospirillum doebereinerae]MCG5240064.1 hypothetical protein [Azospirillum doebereinerae]
MTETTSTVDGGALPAGPQTQEAALRLWIDIIHEARHLGGRNAARRLWAQSPLPPLAMPTTKAKARKPKPKPIPEWVGRFVAERLEPARGVRLRADSVWAAYLAWAPRGREPVCRQTLMRQLDRHGLKRRTERHSFFLNLRLKASQ